MSEKLKECSYFVEGMHCAACEVLIEKTLLENKGVKSVEASTKDGKVTLFVDENTKTTVDSLNKKFKESGCVFSLKQKTHKTNRIISIGEKGEVYVNKNSLKSISKFVLAIVLVLLVFFALQKSTLGSLITINSTTSLIGFFLFGLIAGTSTCAALVGGVLLSMTKQWNESTKNSDSTIEKVKPHILFHIGRFLSFIIFGGLLGLIFHFLGGVFQINTMFTALFTILIAAIMFILGLQMLEVKWAQKFSFTLPKAITRSAANSEKINSRFMPFVTGVATFILPCGFTIAAQAAALASGSFVTGALIMFMFALGTFPMLGIISLSEIKFSQKPAWSKNFNYFAGFLVIFFALFTLNAQLNVLGLTSLNDIGFGTKNPAIENSIKNELPKIRNGKQILEMSARSDGYYPNNMKVRAGIPFEWNVKNDGASGCTNVIVSKSLFEGEFSLKEPMNKKELTINKPGNYKFTCWMGMVSGSIEVVDENGNSGKEELNDDTKPGVEHKQGCAGASGGGCGCGAS